MKKLVAIMALSFGLIFSSYAQEKAPQMRERKMNDSCKMMSPQDNQKKMGERKNFDNKSFYARPQQMRHGMRGFEGQGFEKQGDRKDFSKQGQGQHKMEGMKEGRPMMMNRPEEGRQMQHSMYMRGRGMRGNGNMYHNFPPKPEQKVEVEKKEVVEPVKVIKGPNAEIDESTLPMDEFIKYINYKN